jgi:prevent-host-death family protein
MKTISLADAKKNFSGLAAQVERGTTVVVTRRGEPILEIRPIAQQSAREAVASIRGFRERPGLNRKAPFLRKGETVRQYAHRGHT